MKRPNKFWRKNEKEVKMPAKSKYPKRDYRYKRLSHIWQDIKTRCYNDKSKPYKYYGYLGIKMCQDWHDRCKFIEWALNNGYEDNLTIDRIDSTKNYSPDNCMWVTQSENTRNMAKSYKGGRPTSVKCKCIELDMIFDSVKEASTFTGIARGTISDALNCRSWQAGGYTWCYL